MMAAALATHLCLLSAGFARPAALRLPVGARVYAPPPTPPLRRLAPHAAAAARVVASSSAAEGGGAGADDAPTVLVDGKPVGAGTPVICADDFGAWWMATVVSVRVREPETADVLVHYDGCDPGWDEWIALGSGRVQPRPTTGVAPEQETWRDVGEDLDEVADAELLATLRAERQATIDQWQFNTLCSAHAGAWVGECVRYEARRNGGAAGAGGLTLEPSEPRCVRSLVLPRSDDGTAAARSLTLAEAAVDARGIPQDSSGRSRTLVPQELRAARGAMAVGGAYTVAYSPEPGAPPDDQPLVLELALAHDPLRTPGAADARALASEAAARAGVEHQAEAFTRLRCTLGYAPFDADARRLEWVEIVREMYAGDEPAGSAGAAGGAPDAVRAALGTVACAAHGGPAGTGLYDGEAQLGGAELYSLYAPGGVTVVAPAALRRGAPAALSVDWEARGMRYQADRKAGGEHDGSLLTLELTEAEGSDAKGREGA